MRKIARSLISWQLGSLLFLAIVLTARAVFEQYGVLKDARLDSVLTILIVGFIAFAAGGIAGIVSTYTTNWDNTLKTGSAWLCFTVVPIGIFVCLEIEKLGVKAITPCVIIAAIAVGAVLFIVDQGGAKVVSVLVGSTAIFALTYYFAFRELISQEPSLTNSTIAILIGAFLNTALYFFVWTKQLKIVWQPGTD